MDQPDLSDPKAFDAALDKIFSNLEPGSADPFLSDADFNTCLNNLFPLEDLFSGLGLEPVDPFVDNNNMDDETNDNVFGMFSWDFDSSTSDDRDKSGVNEESTSAGTPDGESSTVQSSAQPKTNEEIQPQLGIQEQTGSALSESASLSPPLSGTSRTVQPKTKEETKPQHKTQEYMGSKLPNSASYSSPSSGMGGIVQPSEMGTETPLLGDRSIQHKAPSSDAPHDRNNGQTQRILADAVPKGRRELLLNKINAAESAIERYKADKTIKEIPNEMRTYNNARRRLRLAQKRLAEHDMDVWRRQMEESGLCYL